MNEVKEAVEFYYGRTTEQYKHILSIFKSDRKKITRAMTTLAATNAVILGFLFCIKNHLK